MERPNVVWIMCDQVRADVVGYSGGSIVRTPVLDRLARSGVYFENAYCSSPICSPARASLVTGLYPHRHRQYVNYTPKWRGIPGCSMDESTQTVGDFLSNEDYRCAIAGVWHLGNDDEPTRGFEDYWIKYSYHDLSLPDPHFAHLRELEIGNPYDPGEGKIRAEGMFPYAALTDPRQQRTRWVVDRALDYLERQKSTREEPFFLMIGIKDPHPPMAVPGDILDEYPPESLPLPPNLWDPLEGKPSLQHEGRRRFTRETLAESDYRIMAQHYYALVAHVDREIGRVVECLERTGLRENTIFVFNSDHGEQLGNHGFFEKGYMYEESVRVPWLISWPARLPAGWRVETPVGGVDVTPTIAELADCDVPQDLDGRSVAKELLAGKQPASIPVFAEIGEGIRVGNSTDPVHFAGHVMALYDGWKYIMNRDEVHELYDLRSDPMEMRNIVGDSGEQERVARMAKMIRDMVAKGGPDHYGWVLQ